MKWVIFFVLVVKVSFPDVVVADTVDVTAISAAERLSGLQFSPAERDSMTDKLTEYLTMYEKLRTVSLPNSLAPSLELNILPAGFSVPPSSGKSSYAASTARLPKIRNDLAYYSVRDLAELIRSKQISSVELTRFFLDRLRKHNPTLHCVVTFTEELAMAQAERADSEIAAGQYKGLLHGIPYGAKDILAVKNYPTTWGSNIFKDQQFHDNAAVVQKLEAAGAVLVAKLSVGELAWGDVWFGGMTRNPWDTASGSSGSSAGSASSVSAGLLPFAIGTETWGSIVSPSTVCGVTGLRPTFGRVSRYGAMTLVWSSDKIGPICRSAEDCAIVFEQIHGRLNLEKDNSTVDYPFAYSPIANFQDIRLGFLANDFASDTLFMESNNQAITDLRRIGFSLTALSLPDYPIEALEPIMWAEVGAAFDELTRTNTDDQMVRQVKDAWPNYLRSARFIPAVEYINANRTRKLVIESMHAKFDSVDVYVAPSWQGNNLLMTNLTGHPSVTVPSGFSKDGTPTSVTFIGKLYDEATLLSVVAAYQKTTAWEEKRPPLFAK